MLNYYRQKAMKVKARNMPLFFTRTTDGAPQSIGVDYDLIEVAPDYDTPKLSYLFYKPKESIENFEIYFYADPFLQSLGALEGLGYFAGARYIDNWIEVYFYSRDAKLLRTFIMEKLPQGVQYELSSKPDEKWRFYFDELMPNEKEKLTIQNRYAIEDLVEAGDNLNAEHDFVHTFYFHTKAQSERVQSALETLGYQFYDSYEDEESERSNVLQMQHQDSVSLEGVDAFCTALQKIIKKEHGIYDGWSTELVEKGDA